MDRTPQRVTWTSGDLAMHLDVCEAVCVLRGMVQQRGSPGEKPSEAAHLNRGESAGLDDGLRCEIERLWSRWPDQEEMALKFRILLNVLIWDMSEGHLEAEAAAEMLRRGPGER